MNFTQSINFTEVINVAETVIEEATGASDVQILNIIQDFNKDIETLTNLTKLIEQTPIKNFTENLIAWDAIERLLIALGLEEVIDVDAVKATVKEFEETLLDPDAILKDVFDFDLTETVKELVAIPTEIPTVEQLD